MLLRKPFPFLMSPCPLCTITPCKVVYPQTFSNTLATIAARSQLSTKRSFPFSLGNLKNSLGYIARFMDQCQLQPSIVLLFLCQPSEFRNMFNSSWENEHWLSYHKWISFQNQLIFLSLSQCLKTNFEVFVRAWFLIQMLRFELRSCVILNQYLTLCFFLSKLAVRTWQVWGKPSASAASHKALKWWGT